jgi:hypothetical protein
MGRHALVTQPTAKPVAKVVANIVTWLGTSAGLAVLAAVTDSVDEKTVVGALVAGGLTSLAGYLKKSRATDA